MSWFWQQGHAQNRKFFRKLNLLANQESFFLGQISPKRYRLVVMGLPILGPSHPLATVRVCYNLPFESWV